MTSKNSFWASSRENQRRRVWVWIVTFLGMFVAVMGRMLVNLSRIDQWYREGRNFSTREEYVDVLHRLSAEMLGFNDVLAVFSAGIAVLIAIQGFSYLCDRRKVDLYHSVPVDKNRRFAVVYVNGVMLFLASYIVNILLGLIPAAARGALNGTALAEIGIAFVWHLLFFLTIYSAAALAVMLTGNLFVTVCMTGVLLLYEIVWYEVVNELNFYFLDTYSTFFVDRRPKVSVLYDYFDTAGRLLGVGWSKGIGALAQRVLPYGIKWIILAVAATALAWFCYRRRPSEAAGRAIAFPKLKPALKVAVAVPAALLFGIILYDASYQNEILTMAGILIGGAVVCGFMEVIYDFDIKSVLRHPVSGGVALAALVLLCLNYKFDFFGYDKYVPEQDEVESVAVDLGNSFVESFWDEDFNYVSSAEYEKEHMFLTDTEPVLALAAKAAGTDKYAYGEEDLVRSVYVLYRLKSGREVGRTFPVNFSDPANEALLNRIVGSREYREGCMQILTDRRSYDYVGNITYSNGSSLVWLPPEEAQELREAIVADLEHFDFTAGRRKWPCGWLKVSFGEQGYGWVRTYELAVYESFTNTIAYLKEKGAYYPLQLDVADVEAIEVTGEHRYRETSDGTKVFVDGPQAEAVAGELYTVSFSDPGEMEQILSSIYPQSQFSGDWHNTTYELDQDYEVTIYLKRGTDYPGDPSMRSFDYRFYAGRVPDFVAEAVEKEAAGE